MLRRHFVLLVVVLVLVTMRSIVCAGPAEDLFAKGNAAFLRDNYKEAAQIFKEVVDKYPSSTVIYDARLNLGLSLLYDENFAAAAKALEPLVQKNIPKPNQDAGQHYLGLAQFYLATTMAPSDPKRKGQLQTATKTFTEHLTQFPSSSSAEDSLYNRALAEFLAEDYPAAQKDFAELVKKYPGSLNLPDYYFYLGSVFSNQASKLLEQNKVDEAKPLVRQALDAYARVDPKTNLIVANRAAMQSADLFFSLAVRTGQKEDYPKALEQYRRIRSKKELVPLLKRNIEETRKKRSEALLARNTAEAERLARQLGRDQGRLKELESEPDPALHAVLRMARCYNQMAQYDEARVLIRRLRPFLNEDLQREADYQLILSYAYQKLPDKADAAFEKYRQDHKSADKEVEAIPYLVGAALLEQKDFEGAIIQFDKSLKLYPAGRMAAESVLRKAQALTALGKNSEAQQLLADFITKNKDNELGAQAQFTLGLNLAAEKNYGEAAQRFKEVRDNPKAGTYQPIAAFQYGFCLLSANKPDEAITALQEFLQKYPEHENAPQAQLYVAMAQQKKGDAAAAVEALREVVRKYPGSTVAPFAQIQIAGIFEGQKKEAEMIEAYQKLFEQYPEARETLSGRINLSKYFATRKEYAKAEAQFAELAKSSDPSIAVYGLVTTGDMYLRASGDLGFYQRLTEDQKKEVDSRLEKAQQAFAGVVEKFADSPQAAVALEGMLQIALTRHKNGTLTQEQVDEFLRDLPQKFTDPSVQARVRLLQAGAAYEFDDKAKAFGMYEAVLQANPDVKFSPQDASRYGDMLLGKAKYDEAEKLFAALQAGSAPNDTLAQGEAAYGLGMAKYSKGDKAAAKPLLEQVRKTYVWHKKRMDAVYALGTLAMEEGNKQEAKQLYGEVIRSPQSSGNLKGESLIGLGDVFASEGALLPNPKQTNTPSAVANYLKAEAFYGPANPELGAKALFKAAEAYEKADNTAEAQKLYKQIVDKPEYKSTPWGTKAASKALAGK